MFSLKKTRLFITFLIIFLFFSIFLKIFGIEGFFIQIHDKKFSLVSLFLAVTVLLVFGVIVREYKFRSEISKLYDCPELVSSLKKVSKVLEGIDLDKCSEREVKRLASKVLPLLEGLMKYEQYSRLLPPELSIVIRDIYYSMCGKHQHYNIGRMRKDLRALKKSLSYLCT